MRPHIRPHRGFSLIELAVAFVVIGIIATIATATFKTVIERARVGSAVSQQETIGIELVSLGAFGEAPRDALAAAIADIDPTSAFASIADWELLAEEATETSGAATIPGEVSWAVSGERIGWAVVFDDTTSVLCHAEPAIVTCWAVQGAANGWEGLIGVAPE